jgi:hypothetical protein
MSVHNVTWDPALLDSILASLGKAGLYERAGRRRAGRAHTPHPLFVS